MVEVVRLKELIQGKQRRKKEKVRKARERDRERRGWEVGVENCN